MTWEKVTTILPSVTHRLCPSCGYILSQLEVDLMVCDMECRCGKHMFSEFQPLRLNQSEKEQGK